MWNFWAGAPSSAFLSSSKKKGGTTGGKGSEEGKKEGRGGGLSRLDDEPSPFESVQRDSKDRQGLKDDEATASMRTHRGNVRPRILGAIVLILAGAVLLYYLAFFVTEFPFSELLAIKIIVVAAVGYLAISAVASELEKVIADNSSQERGATVGSGFRYVGYILLAFVTLGVAGVSGTELLAGGTFTGLVLGLASQQTLSNIFAGLLILTARPFRVGERITISTWQWGFELPSYPPKFFSDNLLVPGYTGTVEDIRLNYTVIRLDEGIPVRLPNSIVIQASVVDHKTSERLVRVRYEVSKPVEARTLVERIEGVVKKNAWVTRPETVTVNVENITPTDVVVVIEAVCRGAYEPPPRTAILVDIEEALEALKSTKDQISKTEGL
jgi:small-conductance mechanosensitive channel